MPPDPDSTSNFGTWAAGIVAGLGGVVFALRKLHVSWGVDGVTMAGNSAQQSLIKQLHDELTRMSVQNTKLADELTELQNGLISLRMQIGELTVEKQQLKDEVVALRKEIASLRALNGGEDIN